MRLHGRELHLRLRSDGGAVRLPGQAEACCSGRCGRGTCRHADCVFAPEPCQTNADCCPRRALCDGVTCVAVSLDVRGDAGDRGTGDVRDDLRSCSGGDRLGATQIPTAGRVAPSRSVPVSLAIAAIGRRTTLSGDRGTRDRFADDALQ